MIWEYPVDKRDEVRRAYWIAGPNQDVPPIFREYVDHHGREFLPIWYDSFGDWLEYSSSENATYCLPCFLFSKPSARFGSNAFVVGGFRSWKKVNEGKNYAFLTHEGKGPNSLHKVVVKKCQDLMNTLQHIDTVVNKHATELVAKNRLRLKVSIEIAKVCAFQGIAFRGHDESPESQNRGNFLKIIKYTALFNDEVASTVLENAPQNASYISPQIQKEILSLYASKVQRCIRAEIGDAKFCIIIDESRDASSREQMAIILRFVDKEGFIRERFFDIVHVEDTKASTLKKTICNVLSHHDLRIQNIRGQGYDGASNMRGEWNGLQALFLDDCPYAYYIYCFAHRLQLVLVATTQSIVPIENFFSCLNLIVNLVSSSSKRHDQLELARAIQIGESIANDELQTGRGKNQIGTIQRPGDTRWGSRLKSLLGLLEMFDPVLQVLEEIFDDKGSVSSKSSAKGACEVMLSFEFVFILHFLIELLGRADGLSRLLQCKSQDILNAIDAVASTKEIIENFQENGWDELFGKVKNFCEKHEIVIPDMNALRQSSKGRIRKSNPVTSEYYFRFEIFTFIIDSILDEMKLRFNEEMKELLKLSSALDPKGGYRSFDIPDICRPAEKFYPADFMNQEKLHLRYQLEMFESDVKKNLNFQHISTLFELCQLLSKTGKSTIYYLLDRLVRLLLTLPVSTATSERAFSAVKIVKTRLRNKMEDDFLSSSLIMNIEKDIAKSFDVDSIIDEFDAIKKRRAQLRMFNVK